MSVRTMQRRRALGAAVVATLMAGGLQRAGAAAGESLKRTFYLIGPRYDSQFPACDDSWALSTIRSALPTKEGRFWNSDLQITELRQDP